MVLMEASPGPGLEPNATVYGISQEQIVAPPTWTLLLLEVDGDGAEPPNHGGHTRRDHCTFVGLVEGLLLPALTDEPAP
jgi:hypothetical protein